MKSSKIVFAVFIPGRKENIGGQVVLHKLVKILCDQQEEVWTNEKPLFECNPNIIKSIPSNDGKAYDLSFTENKIVVALYPEQIKGNPFNAEHVTRWILYHVKDDVKKTWSHTDEIFYFVPGFGKIKEDEKMLTVIDSKLSICHNKGLGVKRKGYCHINKKKYPEGEKILSYLESRDLGNFMENGGFTYLVEEMNKHEFFITYDDATYYSVIAALCGCRSVIINVDPKVSPDDFRKKFPVKKYGVAYGWHDLKHADMTRDLLRDHVKSYEKRSEQSVKDYITFWKTLLKI